MQERKNLMKNKSKIAFLTTILSLGLVLGACGGSNNKSSSADVGPDSSSNLPLDSSSVLPSSSSQAPAQSSSSRVPASSSNQPAQSSSSLVPASSSNQPASSSSNNPSSSSSMVASKHTVTFMVDDEVVQTSQVDHGDYAIYNGDTPTKASTATKAYRFKGWDQDLSKPVTGDLVIHAVFEEVEYASEILVDDFENYSGAASLQEDGGWHAYGYDNATQTWTTNTKAAVSIGYNSVEANKSLRFDSWENGVGYKFVKNLEAGAFNKSANALKFRLMVPKINLVRVLLKGKVTIGGTEQLPSFSYDIHPTSNEFVEYTIPLADDNWVLWDKPGQTIKTMAEWMGIHEDDYLKFLTSIDFFIQGDDKSIGGNGYPYQAYLDSIKFVTLDEPKNTAYEEIKKYDTYTGVLNSGNTIRIDLGKDGAATAKLIDLEVPQTIAGVYTLNDKEITFISADNGSTLTYKGVLADGGKIINFVSATGNYASAAEGMNLGAVQVVEDFESFTESGVAYSQQNYDEDAISGVRGAFYGEHYTAAGSSDFGGSGWQLLPDGKEINLVTDANNVHTGKNSLSLKHFKSNAVRYLQWDLFKERGETRNIRGSKLGFWVKGYVDLLTIYAFRRTKTSGADVFNKAGLDYADFNIGTNVEEWTHIELDLDPAFTYHGFMIKIEKDYQRDSELFVDDIEVYDASPYATYKAPEVKKLPISISYMGKINDLVAAQLFIRSETQVYLMIPGFGETVIRGTYVYDEVDLTMNFDEVTYVASVSEDMKTFIFKSISGTGIVANYLNNLSFKMMDYAENAESYDKDGTMYYQNNTNQNNRSGARGAYYCEYTWGSTSPVSGSGWGLMGGDGAQLSLDTANAMNGKQSLKLRKSTAGKMRYMQWGLFDGTAEAHTGASKFTIWMRNPMDTATTLTVMVYSVQKVVTANNTAENRVEKAITMAANQDWTEYTLDLDLSKSYYGFAIEIEKGTETKYINIDQAYYCNIDNDSYIHYYAKKDMVLNGNLNENAASIKLDEGGKFTFTCAGLGANNVAGTFDFEMDYIENIQVMTLNINSTTIRCSYAVDQDYKVTIAVLSVTGAMEAAIPVGATFVNQ